MPNIDLLPVPLFQGLEPYHFVMDNKPIEAIITREEVINDAVDINTSILTEAQGTQGTLSNRINQSTNPDGSLITSAIDSTQHNIAMHSDGNANLSSGQITTIADLGYTVTNPVPYVRMLAVERNKLSLITNEATSFQLQVNSGMSNIVLFDNQTVTLQNSDSLTWDFQSPATITGNFNLPLNLSHTHNYDLTPVAANTMSPDYVNYLSTSLSTVYMDGSLRVYINGIRLSQSASVYVPPSSSPSGTWTLTKYTENASAGTFALSRAITSADVIRIDFDVAFG